MSEVAEEEEIKLEDVLKSIRGMIDEKNSDTDKKIKPSIQKFKASEEQFKGEDAVLELTDIHEEDEKSSFEGLLSNKAREQVESQINEFANRAEQADRLPSEVSLNSATYQLMHPLIKDWLDNNLPRIVEKVVAEEIRKLIPKK